MVLPAVTEEPPRPWKTDLWTTAEDALAVALEVAEVAREVYAEDLEEVWMFGSRARGDWKTESDLDLLILLSEDRKPQSVRWRQLPELREVLRKRYEYITQSMISLWGGTPQQMRSWDTMFFRSVRRDAIRVL